MALGKSLFLALGIPLSICCVEGGYENTWLQKQPKIQEIYQIYENCLDHLKLLKVRKFTHKASVDLEHPDRNDLEKQIEGYIEWEVIREDGDGDYQTFVRSCLCRSLQNQSEFSEESSQFSLEKHSDSLKLFKAIEEDLQRLYHAQCLVYERKIDHLSERKKNEIDKLNLIQKILGETQAILKDLRDDLLWDMEILVQAKDATEIKYVDLYQTHSLQEAWALFEMAQIYYHRGEIRKSLETTKTYLSRTQKPIEVYPALILKAKAEKELMDFEAAYYTASKAVEIDPHQAEAYLLRSAALFGMGFYERAYSDFRNIRKTYITPAPTEAYLIEFSDGFIEGAQTVKPNEASLIFSPHGMRVFLWATIEDALPLSEYLAGNLVQFFERMRKENRNALNELLPSELVEVAKKWENITPFERGQNVGYALTKYGLEVLAPFAMNRKESFLTYYHEIEKGELLSLFHTLTASPLQKAALLNEVRKWHTAHINFFSNVKLDWENQGKYLFGHRLFDLPNQKTRMTHPNPQGLIHQYGGNGQFLRDNLGESLYCERIFSHDVIGECCDEKSHRQRNTHGALIIYGKDGAHIVPIPEKDD